MVAAEELSASDFACPEGSPRWLPIATIPELASLFDVAARIDRADEASLDAGNAGDATWWTSAEVASWIRGGGTYLGTFEAVPDLPSAERVIRAALGKAMFAPGDLARSAETHVESMWTPLHEIVIEARTSYTATVQPYRRVRVGDGRTERQDLRPESYSETLAPVRHRRWQTACPELLPSAAIDALLPFGTYTPLTSARGDAPAHRPVSASTKPDLRVVADGIREEERFRASASLRKLIPSSSDRQYDAPRLNAHTELDAAGVFVSVLGVWVGSFRYRGRRHPVFINAGTGAVALPSVPRSSAKILGTVGVVAIIGIGGWLAHQHYSVAPPAAHVAVVPAATALALPPPPPAEETAAIAPLVQRRATLLFSSDPSADVAPSFTWDTLYGSIVVRAVRDADGTITLVDVPGCEAEGAAAECMWVPGSTERTEVLANARTDGTLLVRFEDVHDTQSDGLVRVLGIRITSATQGPDGLVSEIEMVGHDGTSTEYWSGRFPAWTLMRAVQ